MNVYDVYVWSRLAYVGSIWTYTPRKTKWCNKYLQPQTSTSEAATSRSSICLFGQGSLHDSIAAHDNFANCPHSADKKTQINLRKDKRNSTTIWLYDISSIPRNKRNKHANIVGTCFLTSSGVLVANRVSVHPVVPVFGFPDQWPPNIPTSGGG